MSLLSVFAVGFLLGMKHATEADHLAAVATLATRTGSTADALRQGAAWGLGHALTLLLFGGGVLMLGHTLPLLFEQLLEIVVGLMLIGLGADVMRRLCRQRIHFHLHRHDGVLHLHAHGHATPTCAADRHVHAHPPKLPARALLVGMMHGLAGSAAMIVLALGAVASVPTGLLYILVFGAGSMIGMALLAAVIAVPLRLSGAPLTELRGSVAAAFGLLSCASGLWLVAEIAGTLLGRQG